MTEATEKQITFARSLKISNPEKFSKEALKELIDQKLKEDPNYVPKKPQNAPNPQNQVFEAKHDIVIQRVEKPHSYEWGPANARHKVYYSTISELKEHINFLKEAGLLENEEVEVQKI